MSTQVVSLRNVEGAELDPPLLATVDIPVVYDGGLIIVDTDYYVWRERHNQWRAANFTVDAS